jgi:hypothetical protein
MQPVSMHDTPHKHNGALPLIAAMLGVFLVIESIVLGYVVTEYVLDEQEDQMEEIVAEESIDEELDEEAFTGVPLVATRANPAGGRINEIVAFNPANDRSRLVYTAPTPMSVGEVLVPQVNFDGRIFFTLQGEGDNPGLGLVELDISKSGNETKIPTFVAELPFTGNQATAFSPDQGQLAALYYNPDFEETSREIVIWNMLTGASMVVGTLNEGEAFTPTIHGFGGADGFSLSWKGSKCVETAVYTLSADGNDNAFLETREYCKE